MAIQQNLLRNSASRFPFLLLSSPPFPQSLPEAQRAQYKTAFLSYSSTDAELARGLQVGLHEKGIKLYLDMEENGKRASDAIDANDAVRIRAKIRQCQYLIFLATERSMGSRMVRVGDRLC